MTKMSHITQINAVIEKKSIVIQYYHLHLYYYHYTHTYHVPYSIMVPIPQYTYRVHLVTSVPGRLVQYRTGTLSKRTRVMYVPRYQVVAGTKGAFTWYCVPENRNSQP